MKTRALSILGVFLLTTTIGLSQDQDYKNFDSNTDGTLDRTEFDEMNNDGFSNWDADGDQAVTDREFYDRTYQNLDRNRDNQLSQEEWDDGYDGMYGDYLDTNQYNQFDANRDGYIDNDEYYEGFRNTDFYSSYDRDRNGSLNQDELNTGVYDRIDQDQDGSINQREYQQYSAYYGNGTMNRNSSGMN